MKRNFIKKKIVMFLLIMTFFCYSWKVFAQIGLHFVDFKVKYTPKKIPDTVQFDELEKYPNKKLIIYINHPNGESNFQLLNNKNHVTIKGSYTNSIDTLRFYKFSKSLGFTDGKEHYRVSVIKYFQPLKSGTWYYFDKQGKLLRKVEYELIR